MSLAIIIDLIIIGIIALCTFIGYRQGLIKVAIKLVSTILAIVISLILYKPVSSFIINNTTIDNKIQDTISDKLLPDVNFEETTLLDTSSLPNLIVKSTENTVNGISEIISTKLIEILALIIIYFIVKIVLRFITSIADLIAKLPILAQLNKLGGTIYGVLRGILIVFVAFAIISLISPMIGENLISNINESYIGSFLYNNNLLLNIII